jgi:tetratricopeptide (TPR) repeat protein
MGERSRRLLAVSYRNAGRFREAAVAYRDLLRVEPGSGDLLCGLAYCLDREGQADYALALLEKAPKAAKASADPWILQAALYARVGKVDAATQALRAAIDRDRGNERAWHNLSALYKKQGLHEFAANCEEEARSAIAAAAAARAKTANAKPREGKIGSAPSSSPAGPGPGKGRDRVEASGLADLDIRSRRRGR